MHQLTLNGVTYQAKELATLCEKMQTNTATPAWKQSIYKFIQEWLGDDATVKVKTSGSTGKPKTITIHRSQMEYSAQLTGKYLGLKKGDKALLCLSADYIAGKMMIARAFTLELDLLLAEPTGNPLEHIPNDAVIDLVAMVPFQLKALLDLKHNRLNDRLSRIKNILLGGAPVSKELRSVIKDFPNHIYETFGMTETVSHIALKQLSGGGGDTYFETTDSAIILGQYDRDCLVIIAPELSPQPVVTNDVVELKDERHFRWLGRVDNVINTGGIKLLPEELEHRISPFVNDRYFFAAKPDKELGQKLVMVIESAPYTTEKLASLEKQFKTVLGRYELPKETIFMTPFVEAGNHKINRKETLSALGIANG
jgi:O-succinylbenzoic acid--CoA ligase